MFDKTHGYSAEIDGSMDYAVNEQLTLSGALSYDLAVHRLGETFSAAYDLGNSWTLNGGISKVDPLAPLVAEAGVGYALNDKLNLDLQYQDLASTKGVAALTVNYAFGKFGG